jgi:hypothetical protein
MSGVRAYSFREGDRSEYLAQFLLSAVGLCTPIPRQEDIGFDFSCSIADQEEGVLSFGFPYLISIKSQSNPGVQLTPSDTIIAENRTHHFDWLFRQNMPTFLGVVDKDEVKLRIFSLLPLWFLYYDDQPHIGTLTLVPRFDENATHDIGKPQKGKEMDNWPGHYPYTIDLGHPVVILDIPTIQDEDRLLIMKTRFRNAVSFAEQNIQHSRLMIPHFYWFAITNPDASEATPGWWFQAPPQTAGARGRTMSSLAPSLISMAMHFKEAGDTESLQACVRGYPERKSLFHATLYSGSG